MVALDTPLCPPGHLPLKGGDWPTRMAAFTLKRLRLVPDADDSVISPLEGEMSGRTEGGTVPPTYPFPSKSRGKDR